MKTSARDFFRALWRLFTEVPGWPDAPLALRVRRSLPILLPMLLAAAIWSWQFGYASPRWQAAHREHAGLLELEHSVAALRLEFSEERVEELAQRESALRRQLPADAAEVKETLQWFEREAQTLGWQVVYRPPTVPESADAGAAVVETQVRCRLKPTPGNAEPFNSLLALLERTSRSPRRIALMRMSISADEGKWQTVEIGLRFVLPVPHAKTPQ